MSVQCDARTKKLHALVLYESSDDVKDALDNMHMAQFHGVCIKCGLANLLPKNLNILF